MIIFVKHILNIEIKDNWLHRITIKETFIINKAGKKQKQRGISLLYSTKNNQMKLIFCLATCYWQVINVELYQVPRAY